MSTALSAAEIGQGRRNLERSREGVLAASLGLSEAQWKFKPAPDRWSIAEVLEHIVLAQEIMLGPIALGLAQAPAGQSPDTAAVDEIVIRRLPERTARFNAPDVMQPTGRWPHSEAAQRMIANYGRLIEYLESTPGLRGHCLEARPLKAISQGAYSTMDGYQWVLATAAHIERHIGQILEVRSDPGFPAG